MSWAERSCLSVVPYADSTSIGYNNQKGKKYWRNISSSFLVGFPLCHFISLWFNVSRSLSPSSFPFVISSVNMSGTDNLTGHENQFAMRQIVYLLSVLWCVYTIFKLYCCCRSLPFCHSLFYFIVPTILFIFRVWVFGFCSAYRLCWFLFTVSVSASALCHTMSIIV